MKQRVVRPGFKRNRSAAPPIDRFVTKIREEHTAYGVCWRWTGAPRPDGYGEFRTTRNDRLMLAHRWSYEFHIGPIPAGLTLDHLCRNRWCVNPWHLDPVTRKVNSLRGEAPGVVTWREGVCQRGHSMADAYVRPDTGARMCRGCIEIRRQRAYARA